MSAKDRTPEPPFSPEDISPPGLEGEMSLKPRFEAPDYRGAGKLKGKVALITGGDSGIGRGVATLFAREGARVALMFLDEETPDAEATREAVEAEGQEALLCPGDVRDPAACARAVKETVARFGGLDILVNNAAFQNHVERIEDLTLEQWDRCFKTNIYGYFYMVKAAMPHLKAGAAIINTGSVVGLEGSPGLLDYGATKGAIHAFTKSLALQLVDREIRVNCVAPGPVWTPLNPAERSDEAIRSFGEDVPMGRPGQPEEIAPTYVFFASQADSGYITGQVLGLLGGATTAG